MTRTVNLDRWRHSDYVARWGDVHQHIDLYTRAESPDLRGESGRGEMVAARRDAAGEWSFVDAHPHCKTLDFAPVTMQAILDFERWYASQLNPRLSDIPTPIGCTWDEPSQTLVDHYSGTAFAVRVSDNVQRERERDLEILTAIVEATRLMVVSNA